MGVGCSIYLLLLWVPEIPRSEKCKHWHLATGRRCSKKAKYEPKMKVWKKN